MANVPAALKKAVTQWLKSLGGAGTLQSLDGSSIGFRKDNMTAGAAPTSGDNFAAGWSLGSLWFHSGIMYVCTGDGAWTRYAPNDQAVPTSGAADGKFLGHASGVPAWVQRDIWGQITRTSSITVSSNGTLTLSNNTEVSGGCSLVSSYGIRVPEAGSYLVSHNTHWGYSGGSADTMHTLIAINGSNQTRGRTNSYITTSSTDTNTRPNLSASAPFTLAANDVVSLYADVGVVDMVLFAGTLSVVRIG